MHFEKSSCLYCIKQDYILYNRFYLPQELHPDLANCILPIMAPPTLSLGLRAGDGVGVDVACCP
jgi:hypothetical protein